MAAAPILVVIDGLLASALVRVADLVITDVLNEEPNTATLTVNQTPHAPGRAPFYPPAFDPIAFVTTPTPTSYPAIRRGQPIEIYGGTLTADALLFAGEIVIVQQFYELDRPVNVGYHLSCTDYTRALNRRKVMKSYPTQSATAIVLDLMASRAADGFTTTFVAPDLPAVAIDFTFEDMNRALTRLANRIGGYWYVDYTKALHFFLEEPGDPPAPLDGGDCFADLQVETDLTQVRTRVLVEGAGTTVLTEIAPGSTVIPVRTAVMFPPTGGQAVVSQQRLTYTGIVQGGAGSLVGPGAAPSAALIAAAQTGSGIEAGTHAYAVTWQTASGESLASPPATVTLGVLAPPATAPILSGPNPGTGPEPGTHAYTVTFVTASGETIGGPGVVITTTAPVPIPPPGATGAAPGSAAGAVPSNVRYATTIRTAAGETLPGPASTVLTTAAPPGPVDVFGPVGVSYPMPRTGGGLDTLGGYQYWLAYVVGDTWESALSAPFWFTFNDPTMNSVDWFLGFRRSSDPRVTGRRVYRSHGSGDIPYLLATLAYNDPAAGVDRPFVDTVADASLGPPRSGNGAIGTAPGVQVRVTIPTTSDPRGEGRTIYRSDAGAPFRRLTLIENLSATEYLDSAASVAGNPVAPTIDTSGGAPRCVVPVSDIPTGPPAVTARKLWRTKANEPLVGAGPFKLLATLADNTTTTYTDTVPDASLGGPIPIAGTATVQQVALSAIATGNASVTARRLYRSAANTTALQLLTTIADNTTTTYTDAASDATLGAAPPGADTSGLQQPSGQVTAGAVVMPVSSSAPFAPAGGWAVVGNGEQVIRYTGLTPGSLTGLPASGPGALTATVAYNASITVAPQLTGVAGITARALIDGEEIYLLIVRDDLAAQQALAAIEGGDGVIEHFIQDRRLSAAGATAVAVAELALFATPEIRVSYTTRDPRTRTGKLVTIALPAPTNLAGAFLIQRVQLSRFHVPALAPLRTVQASSTRFSFDDVLRRLSFEVSA
jgi:hypothetical protein